MQGMQFYWRWNGGTISLKFGVIWEMSVECYLGNLNPMAATRLNQLLKIIAVAGVFISLIITAVFLVFALAGAAGGEEPANVWIIVWKSFFLGLPLCAILYGTLTLRETLRDVLAELQNEDVGERKSRKPAAV